MKFTTLACGAFYVLLCAACGGSTKQQEAEDKSASTIDPEIVLLDTHNDVLSGTVLAGFDISNKLDTGNTDLVRLREGGVHVQVFAVFGGPKYVGELGFAYANQQIDSLYAIAERNAEVFGIAHTPEEARALISDGKIAGMLALEGGHMLDDKIENLDSLIRRGISYMTLTWNNSNAIGSSSAEEEDTTKTELTKGLTPFGREVIKRLNETGVVVDLSHVGEKTFYDVIELSTSPVMASHSNVRAMADVHRNLKDDQIRAIAKTGGVICVTFYAPFLDTQFKDDEDYTGPDVPISKLIDHIDYIVELVGIDHVGIGSDFFGLSNHPYPDGLRTASDYPNLINALYERGYTTEQIKKIASENVLRVFDENRRARR